MRSGLTHRVDCVQETVNFHSQPNSPNASSRVSTGNNQLHGHIIQPKDADTVLSPHLPAPTVPSSYPSLVLFLALSAQTQQRANAERVKEFSVNLRQINSDTAAAARRVTNQRTPTGPAQDSRSKALAFARRIPRPRKRPTAQPAEGRPPDSAEASAISARRRADRRGDRLAQEGWRQGESTGLEALEALQHDVRKKKSQAVRTAR